MCVSYFFVNDTLYAPMLKFVKYLLLKRLTLFLRT